MIINESAMKESLSIESLIKKYSGYNIDGYQGSHDLSSKNVNDLKRWFRNNAKVTELKDDPNGYEINDGSGSLAYVYFNK